MTPDLAKMTDEQLGDHVRNRETLALLTWEPWMHNPKLKHRLHRVAAPALFIRGASDGLVSDAYLQAYAALLPNARIADHRGSRPCAASRAARRFAAAVLGMCLGEMT